MRGFAWLILMACVAVLPVWAQDAGDTPDVGELLRAEKYDEAMEALDAMTKADPENPRPFVQMGFTAHALGATKTR